jgi:hypothetical protein
MNLRFIDRTLEFRRTAIRCHVFSWPRPCEKRWPCDAASTGRTDSSPPPKIRICPALWLKRSLLRLFWGGEFLGNTAHPISGSTPKPQVGRGIEGDANKPWHYPEKTGVSVQTERGVWPSWTLRAPGHEGTVCWYAATRPKESDHRPRTSDHRNETTPMKEMVGTTENRPSAPYAPAPE